MTETVNMETAQKNKAAMRALKRQQAKQKKQQRRDARADTATVCPPDAAGRSLKLRVLGYLCRVPVMFCAVLGLGMLFNSAFRLSEGAAPLLPALLSVSILCLLCYGRWYTTLGAIVAGGGALAVHLAAQPNLSLYCKGVVDVGFNAVLQRLYDAGYYGYARYMTTLTALEEQNRALFLQDFVAAVTVLLALLYVPFLARRIRIVVPLAVTVLTLVPIFTFNLAVSNWAVTAIIAGCCALLVMWGYQRRYDKKGTERQQSELFSDRQRPKLPEEVQRRASLRREERERRSAHRERVRERRATGLVTVEQEINDYLDAPSRKKRSAERERVVESEEEKARRRAERAQLLDVKRYDRDTREARCAMGGMAGISVLLLVLAVLLIPTAAISKPFSTINAIEQKVQYYREFVTATLRGNDAVLEMYAYSELIANEPPHSTTAQTQVFDHVELMRLNTQYSAPLYMQGWVGVNYADGAWTTANADQLYTWRELYDVNDLPAEAMFEGFFQLMDPDRGIEIESRDELLRRYYGYEEYGFISYMINIQRLRDIGPELYLPRVTSDTLRIMNYRTTEQTLLPWAVFFDGVAVSSIINEDKTDFSAQAFVPIHLHSDWSVNLSRMIAAYNASVAEIQRYEDTRNKNNFKPEYMNTYIDAGRERRYSAAEEYISVMSGAERLKVLSDITDAQAYSNFVYDTYCGSANSAIITELSTKLYNESYRDEDYLTGVDEETGLTVRLGLKEGAQPQNFVLASMRNSVYADTYLQRHELTMSVINYLVEHCNYTLEITAPADATLDGVENFLTVTGEGYCVQFASAAALLLREMGIPVRYVEGYLCTDYTRRVNAGDEYTRFVGKVHDDNQHAWIEVWYDGIGWVVYETTPANYIEVYGKESLTASILKPVIRPDVPETPEMPETPVEPEAPETPEGDEEAPESGISVQQLLRLAGIAVGVMAVFAAILTPIAVMRRRAKAAQAKRMQLAQDMLAHHDTPYADESERATAAKSMLREVFALLALYGSAPTTGELQDDYAKRLSFAYESVFGYPMEYDDGTSVGERENVSRFRIGAILQAISAEEFGYGMSREDMVTLAKFYLALYEIHTARIPRLRRFVLRYFKRAI